MVPVPLAVAVDGAPAVSAIEEFRAQATLKKELLIARLMNAVRASPVVNPLLPVYLG